VRIACDHAKDTIARLTGQPLLSMENTEKTISDYKTRIEKTIAYMQSTKAAAFQGAEERDIEVPLMADMVFATKGTEFLRDWSLAEFLFSRHHRLRHLASQRCGARQTRFHELCGPTHPSKSQSLTAQA